MLVQHWLLLVSYWQQGGRSLYKAAKVLRIAVGVVAVVGEERRLRQELQALRARLRSSKLESRYTRPISYQLLLTVASSP